MQEIKKHTQLGYLQNFEFEKTPVMAGNMHTGEMIALRPCVENLGLNWSGQLQAIKRNSKFDQLCASVKAVAEDGKIREMICLPPSAFQDWLWSLNPKSENFNADLWESYKRGLVMHLLLMLKVSLDKVQQLQLETDYVEEIRDTQKHIDKLDSLIAEKSSYLTGLKRERKNLDEKLKYLLRNDPNQLRLGI